MFVLNVNNELAFSDVLYGETNLQLSIGSSWLVHGEEWS